MKKTIKTILIVLGIVMLTILILAIIGVTMGYNYYKDSIAIEDHSILEIKFDSDIPERSQDISIAESLAFGASPTISLRQMIDVMDYAATDPKIVAVSIVGTSKISHSKAVEVADIIHSFKESGKPVYAYGNYYSQGGYLISSPADSIFINPSGSPDLKGFSIAFTYLKDFFEKYKIDMEIFVAGKYKSSVETYNRNEGSPEKREQYTIYLDQLQKSLISEISKYRGIPTEELDQITTDGLAFNASISKKLKLVDALAYNSDYLDFLLKVTDQENDTRISLSKYQKYVESKVPSEKEANTAFVVIEGEIVNEGTVSSAKNLRTAFREIRKNKHIETIILRINTPGGSAFASEEIWHEVELCKEKGIQVIASVSAISASGGYYLMCGSDKIFANPTSIAGSIGVYIAFPTFENALEHNLSIHVDKYETGPHASRPDGMHQLNNAQKQQFQTITEELYGKFVQRVADGRNITPSKVDEIAQGRIYTGSDALNINLIDSLISLHEVLEYVANRSEKDMIIQEYPKQNNGLFPQFDRYVQAKINSKMGFKGKLHEKVEGLHYLWSTKEPMARAPIFEVY